MNKTDVLIIGAGPTGLFCAHQLGIIGLSCEIVDNLDKLHQHIKDQLPKPNNGLIDAYKEIIPALMKQKNDKSYFIRKELPELQNI